jgi:alkylhydroperoxidase/carboxymuconolactone decarboxylase family protein YurZ
MPSVHHGIAENEERLLGLALGDGSMIRRVTGIDPDGARTSGLAEDRRALLVIAALVAVRANEVSFGAAAEAAFAAGADPEEIAGVLISLVPVVGLATVRGAAGNVVQALASDPDVQRTFVRTLSEAPVRLFIPSA